MGTRDVEEESRTGETNPGKQRIKEDLMKWERSEGEEAGTP